MCREHHMFLGRRRYGFVRDTRERSLDGRYLSEAGSTDLSFGMGDGFGSSSAILRLSGGFDGLYGVMERNPSAREYENSLFGGQRLHSTVAV